jgi:hypothetical protein
MDKKGLDKIDPPKRSFWDRLKDEKSSTSSPSDREMQADREKLLSSIKMLFKAARPVHRWFCRGPSRGWFEGWKKPKGDLAKKPDDKQ